jgi:AcrR family transcriptional regulator
MSSDTDQGAARPARPVDREAVFEAVWRAPLMEIASDFGMSANGLAKLCDRQGIPRPDRGYWRMTPEERRAARPAACPPAGQIDAPSRQHRPRRSRLPIEERRAQLLDIAARIVEQEGTEQVSLNRLAREAGISEAQAHNCFARRVDVLAELARREVRGFEESRKGVVLRGQDRLTRIVLSTANYLTEAERRGGLIHALLLETEVREILRSEHEQARQLTSEPIVESMRNLHSMSLRTGGLVANGDVPLASAMRLCLPMVMGCVRSNARSKRTGGMAA